MDEQTVAVSLPTDVVYVSGTVNGMEYTWTNVDTDRWEAVVARTESEIYVVALTLINDLGTVSEANFTLYYGVLNLVTDRTERDVERWRLLHSKGYAALTEAEKANMALSGRIITLTIGIRFLTDYLDGDVYFQTAYDEHNLVRCRTQLKMVESMEAQKDDYERIVRG